MGPGSTTSATPSGSSLSLYVEKKSDGKQAKSKFNSRSLTRSASVTSFNSNQGVSFRVKKRFSFNRPSSVLVSPAQLDYTLVPGMLRHDLQRQELGWGATEQFVKNIKYSIGLLAKTEETDEQGRDTGDKLCQQELLRKLFDQPYCKFTAEDFPLLVKLIRTKRASAHSAILAPLAAMIAHSFVADMAGLHDLSPLELDKYRQSEDQKEKEIGERLTARLVFLCSDDTPMEQLEDIAREPELINKVGFSKRKARLRMEQFRADLDSFRIRATGETYAVKGLFLVFLGDTKRRNNEFYILETFETANKYLQMLHERTGEDVEYFNLQL